MTASANDIINQSKTNVKGYAGDRQVGITDPSMNSMISNPMAGK